MAGRRRPVRWSPDALTDLSDIWDYYANVAGRQTADNIIRDVEKACHLLEEYPMAGRARDQVRVGLRSIAASPYVVFYQLATRAPTIVRVLHGRRDIDEIFSEDQSG
jgi:toxin ParE1/3/4